MKRNGAIPMHLVFLHSKWLFGWPSIEIFFGSSLWNTEHLIPQLFPWPWLPSASPWGRLAMVFDVRSCANRAKMTLKWDKMGLLYITWLLDTFMTLIEIGILLVINFPPCGHLCIFKRQEPSSYLDVGRFQHTLFPHFSTANLCKSLYKVDCMAILLHVLLCNLLPKSWCIHKWYQTGRTYWGSSLLFRGIQFPFLWQQWNISWNFTHRMLHLRCSFLSACCRMRLSLNND